MTAVTENIAEKLSLTNLSIPQKTVCGPDRKPLPVQGEFSANMVYRGRQCTQYIYVVKGLQENILGFTCHPKSRATN